MMYSFEIAELQDMLNQKMDILLNAIPDHIIIFKNREGHWLKANQYALSVLGISGKDYIGKTSVDLDLCKDLIKACEQTEARAWNLQKQMNNEVSMLSADGKPVNLNITITPVFSTSESFIVVVGQVIDDQKCAEGSKNVTHYDLLTGFPNRKMYEDELSNALVVANVMQQKVVLMIIDIDRFKMINDSLGATIGDQLLLQFSERLRQCKKDNWLFARLGDDEFALLISNIGGDHPKQIAQEIMDCTKAPFYLEKYELFITISIGISEFPLDAEDGNTLYQQADIALSRAKEQGKNRYEKYKNTMDIAAFKSFSLKNDLHKALLLQEFEVYYQPKIDIHSNQIIGAEALIRWNHPEWGLVSPTEFISIAEETGLIKSIGEWMLSSVCEQIRIWEQSGFTPIPIAVNISPKQFVLKDFIESFMDTIHVNKIEPHLIEIEITETSVIENEELLVEVIEQLHEFGIKVALDDFGTGYSSLSYLNQFHIDSIKIDRSFIHSIGVDSQNEAIVKGIIQLVKSLNINIIAEGVETEAQLSFLRDNQCDQIQGYLYSKPVPESEFRGLLQDGGIDLSLHLDERSEIIENQRKYYRINLTHPLSADMTIARYKGMEVALGNTEVLLEDIGLGGVRFISNIELAVIKDIILKFETEILGELVTFLGTIVWKKEIDDGVYEYGLEFIIDESDRDELAMVLNMFSTKIRRNPVLPDCRFVTTNSKYFFKNKSIKSSYI